ncbi:biotin/lipoyl-containing protein, partial [Chitiniphilus shinanonensis]
MSNIIELKVPDIGDHSNVDVIEVFVAAGDSVAVEQSLITLETDKATMEVPATAAGVIKEVKVKVGDKVSEGSVIALVEASAGAATAAPQPAPAPAA